MSLKDDSKSQMFTPNYYIEKYKGYLNEVGAIRTEKEALWFSNSIGSVKLDVERCILFEIIERTINSNRHLLEKFLLNGGWSVLNDWLDEYLSNKNIPFLKILVHLYDRMPISMTLLKKGNVAKLLISISKLPNMDVKNKSRALVRKWKSFVSESTSLSKDGESAKSSKTELKAATKVVKRTKLISIESASKLNSDRSSFMKALDQAEETKKLAKIANKVTLSPPTNYIQQLKNENLEPSSKEVTDDSLLKNPDSAVTTPKNEVILEENKRKKKSVTWASDENLVMIRYFEKIKYCDVDEDSGEIYDPSDFDENSFFNGYVNNSFMNWNSLIEIERDEITSKIVFGEASNEKFLRAKHQNDKEQSNKYDVIDHPFPSEPVGVDLGNGVKPNPPRNSRYNKNVPSDPNSNRAFSYSQQVYRMVGKGSSQKNSKYGTQPLPHVNPHVNRAVPYQHSYSSEYDMNNEYYDSNYGTDYYNSHLHSNDQMSYQNQGRNQSEQAPYYQSLSARLTNASKNKNKYSSNSKPSVKKQLCRVYSSGSHCRFGDACHFIHANPSSK